MLALLPLATAARPARAQCDGRIVSAITIVPRDPSFLRFPRVLRPLARGVGLHHTTTKPDVIRSFLLLHLGRRCTERQRAESERILRFQPFLADATVRAIPDAAGGVRIEVETIDEIPTVFAMRFQGGEPAALRIGNANVGGRGVLLAVRGERGFAYRNGVGVQLVTYQAFGGPYTFGVIINRTPLGSTVNVDLGHPFITDLQPTAWHVGFREVRGLTAFVRPESSAVALGALRRFADLGAVVRVGVRGRSAFIGGLITDERVAPASQAVIVSDSGLVADTSMQLAGPFVSVNSTRLNAVVGVSSVVFLPVRGFDALVGAQDLAKGVQLGAIIGRGVSWFGASDHDLFVAADGYAGLGSASSFAALRVEGEWRQDRQSGRWEAVVGSGRLAWYVKPFPAVLVIGSAEFSGGWRWHNRFPFQLRLGDREGGVRGYSGSRQAGAVRSVGRLEARRFIGRLTKHVALGLATFVDAGKVWAGDAPFGVTSKTQVGVGGGLLAAIPPQSRQLWRLVFAVPVSPDAYARWELRLSVLRVRGFWREPGDVARARAGASSATIFTWP